MAHSRKRIILFSLTAILLIVGCAIYFYATNRPEYLASRASLIPRFLNISSSAIGADDPNFCIDEIHSQGRDFDDFGSAGYVFDVPRPYGFISDELYRHPNSSLNDSTLIIKVRRGDILGTLSVEFDTGRGNVQYIQIYD